MGEILQQQQLEFDSLLKNSCFILVFSWKLSKTRQLSPNTIQAINNAISDYDVLDNRYYETVDHTDDGCFNLPDLAPGDPVVFGGQCDPNLPVVSNFDASRVSARFVLDVLFKPCST